MVKKNSDIKADISQTIDRHEPSIKDGAFTSFRTAELAGRWMPGLFPP
jgi:hypothetical protein